MPRSLDPESVVATVERLCQRVHERFPDAGLARVADELLAVARTSKERAIKAGKPLLPLRVALFLLAAALLAGFVTAMYALLLRARGAPDSVGEMVQTLEAATSEVVFVGIAIVFVASLENQLKRGRLLSHLHELRSLAHIVDLHQLTKDPDRVLLPGPDTPSSPERSLSAFELGRYLDYCTEMLSLIGKLAAMYAPYTTDRTSLEAIDQIEDLTSGLAHKIWQKIMLVHQLDAARLAALG